LHRSAAGSLAAVLLGVLWLLAPARPARAVLDVEDRGPSLKCGNFELRVTNAGTLGNAFTDRSFDPSFEFPQGSGQELMSHADLWVGAQTDEGVLVSGGPLLEWRPTLDPEDRVHIGWHGQLGSNRSVDDDDDGVIDEEQLNGRDDDGDGEIDEDLGFPAQQVLSADFVDDRPEAVQFLYPNGEQHHPLHLSVHQEVYGWSVKGYDGIAGIEFTITNHGDRTLRNVRVGLHADLDSRGRDDPLGHTNDKIERRDVQRVLFEGEYDLTVLRRDTVTYTCFKTLGTVVPLVVDSRANLPCAAVVGLGHTTDPLAQAAGEGGYSPAIARAPGTESFVYSVFAKARPAGSGGLPITDEQRYDALAGRFAPASEVVADDYTVLVSCGPFRSLAPGQSISVRFALVAGASPDSIPMAVGNALETQYGTWLNALPDSVGSWTSEWNIGNTGLNGHDVCLAPPIGVSFRMDPHCGRVIPPEGAPAIQRLYTADHCIWTDVDCDKCTGIFGRDTQIRWKDPGSLPPSPTVRVTPGDRQMKIEWDNMPEILLREGIAGPPDVELVGYAVYRSSDWRGRRSPLPPREAYALVGSFGTDSASGQVPLATVTDATIDYLDVLYEQRRYPPGRYSFVDRDVFNGFDYVYVVATLVDRPIFARGALLLRQRYESPLVASFSDAQRPRAEARAQSGGVWVVPNPFRATAGWDRAPVYGDRLTRHVDFMGLPRARCTIRIWTVAGDLVREIDHDGSGGVGQAAWDLVTRNGQEAESGIYVFTVDSSAGSDRGRFVVIR